MDMLVTPDVLLQSPAILQFNLNAAGYDAGSMDGAPGAKTRSAVIDFQKDHCLPVPGIADQITLEAILSFDGSSSAACERGAPTAEPQVAENPKAESATLMSDKMRKSAM